MAAKAHQTAAVVVHVGDEGVVDSVQRPDQFLGAPARAESCHQFVGELGETDDVGKEGCAFGPIGQGMAPRQGVAAIHGKISTQALDVHPPPLSARQPEQLLTPAAWKS